MRHPFSPAFFFIFLIVYNASQARFNLETCFPPDPDFGSKCIERGPSRQWCFNPDNAADPFGWMVHRNCSREATILRAQHAPTRYEKAMTSHLQGVTSIAYYSTLNGTLLGGADWPLPENFEAGTITVCLSGLGRDTLYFTICVDATSDNMLPNPNSRRAPGGWCAVHLGQPNLRDGCYSPPPTANAAMQNGSTLDDLIELNKSNGRVDVDGSLKNMTWLLVMLFIMYYFS